MNSSHILSRRKPVVMMPDIEVRVIAYVGIEMTMSRVIDDPDQLVVVAFACFAVNIDDSLPRQCLLDRLGAKIATSRDEIQQHGSIGGTNLRVDIAHAAFVAGF